MCGCLRSSNAVAFSSYVWALRVDAILHLAPPAGPKGQTYDALMSLEELVSLQLWIYIYIEREREREREVIVTTVRLAIKPW